MMSFSLNLLSVITEEVQKDGSGGTGSYSYPNRKVGSVYVVNEFELDGKVFFESAFVVILYNHITETLYPF